MIAITKDSINLYGNPVIFPLVADKCDHEKIFANKRIGTVRIHRAHGSDGFVWMTWFCTYRLIRTGTKALKGW